MKNQRNTGSVPSFFDGYLRMIIREDYEQLMKVTERGGRLAAPFRLSDFTPDHRDTGSIFVNQFYEPFLGYS